MTSNLSVWLSVKKDMLIRFVDVFFIELRSESVQINMKNILLDSKIPSLPLRRSTAMRECHTGVILPAAKLSNFHPPAVSYCLAKCNLNNGQWTAEAKLQHSP